MTDDQDEFRAYAVHLVSEHRRLSELLQRIEQQCEQPSHPDLAECLNQLRAELATHFDEEECGGCLEEAVVHVPILTAEAGQVLSEHPSLLAELDRLIEQIGASQGSKLSLDAVKQEFAKFAQRLRAHEAAENQILQKSFGMDIP
jgi:hypothetical protein